MSVRKNAEDKASKHILVTEEIHKRLRILAAQNGMIHSELIDAALSAFEREQLSEIDLDGEVK